MLDPGSVSVDPTTGAVSGSGFALALYQAEAVALTWPAIMTGTVADLNTAWNLSGDRALADLSKVIPFRISTAAKCNALAAAHVALIQSATVTVPVPSTPTTAIGVVT